MGESLLILIKDWGESKREYRTFFQPASTRRHGKIVLSGGAVSGFDFSAPPLGKAEWSRPGHCEVVGILPASENAESPRGRPSPRMAIRGHFGRHRAPTNEYRTA